MVCSGCKEIAAAVDAGPVGAQCVFTGDDKVGLDARVIERGTAARESRHIVSGTNVARVDCGSGGAATATRSTGVLRWTARQGHFGGGSKIAAR